MADKEKKKKKDKVSLSLPNAWQTMKKRNETAQAKANFEGFWKAIGILVIIVLVIFVAFGGISQTGFLKFIFNWSHNVQDKAQDLVSHVGVESNEDGIYLKINSDEEVEEAKKNQAEIKDISESSLLNEKDKTVEDGETVTEEIKENVTPTVSVSPTKSPESDGDGKSGDNLQSCVPIFPVLF